ncbi:TetR/AcrR family transcriptional regulator [Inediibacterium massiliense]|uniref:TetR/AcrR family transcriptional regulator n=1 Tax=Inediibacterium massiliense TaxID=1658111 RepID=UPI0006B64ED5|nr:TetR/AcrR family transcriptional regulator [Inediibacterium massiliense]
MARPFSENYDDVMKYAKEEFLQKGFKDASLRNIAQKARVTTGLIYSRFSNKEELFSAVVSPVLDKFNKSFFESLEDFNQKEVYEEIEIRKDYSTGELFCMIEYIYEHFDIFKILVTGSDGTKYKYFIDKMVELEEEYTKLYIKKTGNDCYEKGRLSDELLHILTTAFFNGVFEVVKHHMPKDQAIVYITQLNEFYNYGWKNIFKE